MKGIKRSLLTVLLAGALLAAGCLIADIALSDDEPYFFDRLGELMLIGRGRDLYIIRMESGAKRKITSTPEVTEEDAFFSNDGRFVLYKTKKKKSAFDKTSSPEVERFMQPIDANDLQREEINFFLYKDFKKERIKGRKETD
ncbi:hypothetical protein OAA99_02180 [Omnitrophica bacterium]|nr:hypothetical protein [Candidatus Omnitrophota bacterium]